MVRTNQGDYAEAIHQLEEAQTAYIQLGDAAGEAALLFAQAGDQAMQVPGGKLEVTLVGTAALLGGPAVIVAEGELDPVWLSAVLAGSLPGR